MDTLTESTVSIPATRARIIPGVGTAWWDYASILAGQGVFAVLTVVATVLSARLLGSEGYGTVALFMGVVQLFFVVGVKWSFPAVMRYGREALVREGAAGRVFWAWAPLFTTAFIISSCVLLAGYSAGATVVGITGGSPAVFIEIFALTAMTGAVVQLLKMQGKMKAAAWSPVEGRVVFVALLTALTLLKGWRASPLVVILCVGIAMVVQALISLPRLGRNIIWPMGVDWSFTKSLTRYSLALWLGFLASYLCDWVDLYFIRFLHGPAQVGVYQISYQAFLLIGSALIGMNTLVFPLLTTWRAEGREDYVTRYIVRFIPQVTVLWGLLVLSLGVLAEPLFLLLFGFAFHSSARLFFVLLIGCAFQPIAYLYSPLFLTHDRPHWDSVSVLVMAVVNVVGDALLVPRLGAFGAACATAASFAAYAWCALWWGNRRIGVACSTALVAASIVAGSLAVVSGASQAVKVSVLVTGALLLLGWTRVNGIFSSEDLALFDHIGIPPKLSLFMKRVYQALS